MCGLFGCLSDRDVDQARVEAALDALAHRGPDSRGVFRLSVGPRPLVFGHTRLSIVDMSPAGAQPMTSADGRWTIVFNGEIYNHRELRKELPKVYFRGSSDTETIVELVAEFGIHSAVRKLNGIFAFAAYDQENTSLSLVRDPHGVKPLYFKVLSDAVIFASEIKGIRALDREGLLVSSSSIGALLTLGYLPAPRTLWQEIRKVRPGQIIHVSASNLSVKGEDYVCRAVSPFTGSFPDAVAEYGKLISAAVERQLMADVDIGIFLSGGVDSALIAAHAQNAGAQLTAYTVGFIEANTAYSETEAAKESAHSLGIPIESIMINPHEYWNKLPRIAAAIEEPIAVGSLPLMWGLSETAGRNLKVVLTGQGFDEMLGGYNRYRAMLLGDALKHIFPARTISYAAKVLAPNSTTRDRFSSCLGVTDFSFRYRELVSVFSQKERQLLTGNPSDGGALEDVQDRFDQMAFNEVGSHTLSAMSLDMQMELPESFLLYTDKIGMAHGLEIRVPALDLELARFTCSLPLTYRCSIGRSKIIHRHHANRVLPSRIVNRRKLGFVAPFRQWAESEWRSPIEDLLLDSSSPLTSIFDRDAIANLWSEFLAGSDHTKKVLLLVFLALCLNQEQ